VTEIQYPKGEMSRAPVLKVGSSDVLLRDREVKSYVTVTGLFTAANSSGDEIVSGESPDVIDLSPEYAVLLGFAFIENALKAGSKRPAWQISSFCGGLADAVNELAQNLSL
jgi:hypothetical protein